MINIPSVSRFNEGVGVDLKMIYIIKCIQVVYTKFYKYAK